jgi:organic radical activating enzyme
MSTYRLNAIFSSLQGEGRNVGRPATFVRFASCNLKCNWCDAHKTARLTLSSLDILRAVQRHSSKSVIITGGEPTIQPGLSDLVRELKGAGYWVALETNGTHAPHHPELFDYIAVSPKSEYSSRYLDATMIHKADEVRIVAVTDEISPFCRNMRERIAATDYYISPLEKDGRIHYRRALNLLVKVNKLSGVTPPWALSIQMHKVLGIR